MTSNRSARKISFLRNWCFFNPFSSLLCSEEFFLVFSWLVSFFIDKKAESGSKYRQIYNNVPTFTTWGWKKHPNAYQFHTLLIRVLQFFMLLNNKTKKPFAPFLILLAALFVLCNYFRLGSVNICDLAGGWLWIALTEPICTSISLLLSDLWMRCRNHTDVDKTSHWIVLENQH